MSELALIYVDPTKHILGAVLHLGTYGDNPDPKLLVGNALPQRSGAIPAISLLLPVSQLKVKILDPANVDPIRLPKLLADPQGFYLKDTGDLGDASTLPLANVAVTAASGDITVTLPTNVSSPAEQLLCAVQDLALTAPATVPAVSTFDAPSKKASVTGPVQASKMVSMVMVTGFRPVMNIVP